MSKTLVIIEGAGKINKIQSLMGNKYLVMATMGHIIDLNPKEMSVDIQDNFKPIYITTKPDVVKKIEKAAKMTSDIILCSDPDREGENISWSVAHVLKLKNPKRVTFGSITKTDIFEGLKKPRLIDMNLVNAQKARRILDRLVGYELSPLLMKHIGAGKLSAGRVQSVVVKLIIDRENEIINFKPEEFFKVKAMFTDNSSSSELTATLHNLDSIKPKAVFNDVKYYGVYGGSVARIDSKKTMITMLNIHKASQYRIANTIDKKHLSNPSPPFTTSTLQQEASRKFGFPIKRTMDVAQHLYEEGYITYLRTDSVNLSKEGLDNIKQYVLDNYGKKYYRRVEYKAKTKNTQEAHEAIRPTDVAVEHLNDKKNNKIGSDEVKLYSLIWKRSVASQMVPAEYNEMNIQISILDDPYHYYQSSAEKLIFDGFLKVYNLSNNQDDSENENENDGNSDSNKEIKTVPLIGDYISVKEIEAQGDVTRPPPRYNDASLIDKMSPNQLNIGRPATTQTIIGTILNREYVKKEDCQGVEKNFVNLKWNINEDKFIETKKKVIIGKESNKFVPTLTGIKVNTFLVKSFPDIMDYKFTALMEKRLDQVAKGKLEYYNLLKDFYTGFHEQVVSFSNAAPVDDNSRKLGIHPAKNLQIIATNAKYGPVVKMLTSPKPTYAKIIEPYDLDSITLDEAVKLLDTTKYPLLLGKYKNKNIKLHKGKYGLYLQYGEKDSKNYQVEGDSCDLGKAVEIIESKGPLKELKNDRKIFTINEGPYGRFIRIGDIKDKKNVYTVPLTEEIDVGSLTLEEVQKIISEHFDKKKGNAKPFKKNNQKYKK